MQILAFGHGLKYTVVQTAQFGRGAQRKISRAIIKRIYVSLPTRSDPNGEVWKVGNFIFLNFIFIWWNPRWWNWLKQILKNSRSKNSWEHDVGTLWGLDSEICMFLQLWPKLIANGVRLLSRLLCTGWTSFRKVETLFTSLPSISMVSPRHLLLVLLVNVDLSRYFVQETVFFYAMHRVCCI